MKSILILLIGLFLVVLFSGCVTEKVVEKAIIKFQCQNGNLVDQISQCAQNQCEQNQCEVTTCPKLDCNICSSKTEIKTITNTIYVCADLREVNTKEECSLSEPSQIDSSIFDLNLIINSFRTTDAIGEYSLEKLTSEQQFLIIDFSIINTTLDDGWTLNQGFISIEDSKGYSYDMSADSQQLSKYGGNMNIVIQKNEKKSEELAFVVPITEKDFTLIVNDFSGIRGKIKFSLNN